MQIHVKSDLHMEATWHKTRVFSDAVRDAAGVPVHLTYPPHSELHTPESTDVVVLAGDIVNAQYLSALILTWGNSPVPVIYVAGNHEYWGSTIEGYEEKVRAACKGTAIVPLFQDYHIIDDVVFIGGTLWTPLMDPLAQMWASNWVDFKLIKGFRLNHWQSLHMDQKQFIYDTLMLDSMKDLKKVVVSHHLTCSQSIAVNWRASGTNVFFDAECSDIIKRLPPEKQPKYWIHGHTHDSKDYMLDQTHVICNPYGHFPDCNPDFNSTLILEV